MWCLEKNYLRFDLRLECAVGPFCIRTVWALRLFVNSYSKVSQPKLQCLCHWYAEYLGFSSTQYCCYSLPQPTLCATNTTQNYTALLRFHVPLWATIEYIR